MGLGSVTLLTFFDWTRALYTRVRSSNSAQTGRNHGAALEGKKEREIQIHRVKLDGGFKNNAFH